MNKNRAPHIAIRPTRTVLAGLLATAAAGLTILAVGMSTATATTEKTVEVPGNQEWTDTGIALSAGEKVTISASGSIKWGGGTPLASPVGRTFGQSNGNAAGTCASVVYGSGTPFPAPSANCYSMLFRIGTPGVAFPTGKKISFTSPVAGELFLGVNDTFYPDNSGFWTATVTTP